MRSFPNVPYIDDGNDRHKLNLYLPDTDVFPIYVFFHGGGFVNGSRPGYDYYKCLVEEGVGVASVGYRLYPEAKYPDFILDGAASVAWVKEHIGDYGVSCSGIYIGGSSAGAYLTQMLCFNKDYLGKYGIDSDKISGYIMDAGQPTTHFNVLKERGYDKRRVIIDDAAPLYYVTEGREYAPMLIVVSENDIPNRYEQTMLLIGTLRDFGCEREVTFMKGCTHTAYPLSPMALEFIKKQQAK